MGGFRELRWVIPGNMCGNLVSKLNIKISESVKLHTGDSLGINTEMLKSWTKGLNQGGSEVVCFFNSFAYFLSRAYPNTKVVLWLGG